MRRIFGALALAGLLTACAGPDTDTDIVDAASDLADCRVEFHVFAALGADAVARQTSAALVDREVGRVWMFDATAEIADQLDRLRPAAGADDQNSEPAPELGGVFLTDAEMDRITGLMSLRSLDGVTRPADIHAMPRPARLLREEGPWSRRVANGDIRLRPLEADRAVVVSTGVSVTPVRTDDPGTIAYRIATPGRDVVYGVGSDAAREGDLVIMRGTTADAERHCLVARDMPEVEEAAPG